MKVMARRSLDNPAGHAKYRRAPAAAALVLGNSGLGRDTKTMSQSMLLVSTWRLAGALP